MIIESICFNCTCSKCKYQWVTKDATLPAHCSKCKTTKWNNDYIKPKPLPELSLADRVGELSAPERLEIFEHFELCCGMNRGSCVCEPEADRIAQIGHLIVDDRKSVLNALQAKIDAIQDHNIAAVLQPENEWIGWTPEQQTYDDQTGEMRTYRKHIKTGRTKWIDSETYFG